MAAGGSPGRLRRGEPFLWIGLVVAIAVAVAYFHRTPPPLVIPPPVRGAAVVPIPLISRNAPAFASTQALPAGDADGADTSRNWRSSGPMPAWLAYDLSGVPPAHRGNVIVVWYDTQSYDYDSTASTRPTSLDQPRDYALEGNAARGGAIPTGGWATLVTVRANTMRSREHVLNLAGYNWLRLDVTAVNGVPDHRDVQIRMDVHDDAGGRGTDSWMFYGDSITSLGLEPAPVGGVSALATLINAQAPRYYPIQEDGGQGGISAGGGPDHLPGWLPLFPGHYVVIALGSTDAEECLDPSTVHDAFVTMVDAVVGAGKVPVIPHIPWARDSNVQQCGDAINAQIDAIYAAFPRVVRGPDLWTFFRNHQDLISDDDVHPTAAGLGALRQQWAATMIATVYKG